MLTRIVLLGAGRMGQAILALAQKDKDVKVTAVLNRKTELGTVLDHCDVIIDFTSAEATFINGPKVAQAGKALVVGTTGLVGEARERFIDSVKTIPVVFSSNMSVSANILFDLTERVARALPDYDSEIVEIHHRLKKDSPSGTAQSLAEAVKKGKGKGRFLYGRQGLVGERTAEEIGIHAVRGGDVVGDHTVLFLGKGERLELVHRVTSREAFAQGALTAARWLVEEKKSSGLYAMRDVLGL
jgi:4-hydroxy-tetrahydrodipicolinate reductase